jgi:hypothetical protein
MGRGVFDLFVMRMFFSDLGYEDMMDLRTATYIVSRYP